MQPTSTPPNEPNTDEWVRQLAGEKPASGTADPEVAVLREVILDEDKRANETTAADELMRARLLKRLENEGLLAASGASKSTASATSKPRARMQWMSAAAAVLVVAFGVFSIIPFGVDLPVDRGITGSVTIVSDNAEQGVQTVITELTALGFEPARVTFAGRVVVDVQVSKEQLSSFYEWAVARNGRAVTPGKYRIFINSAIDAAANPVR